MFFSENSITVSSNDMLCVIGCGNGNLEFTDSNQIDYLVIQDFTNATIENFGKLSEAYDIEYIYIPDYIPEGEEYEAFLNACYQEDSYVIEVEGSMSFAVGDGSVTVSAGENANYDNKNDYSLMTKIALEKNRMLLCGSAGEERIAEFLLYEKEPFSHIILNENQKGKEEALLQTLLPECLIFTDCEAYVDGYEVYDTTDGPIIYKG